MERHGPQSRWAGPRLTEPPVRGLHFEKVATDEIRTGAKRLHGQHAA
ncbi:hypothetical protein HMPREF0185_00870 [Brevundimonas diminuta 470-4]|nr:hypothetical protein HMPREF0185_00870 [Brevundimonas diminuta 470-4]